MKILELSIDGGEQIACGQLNLFVGSNNTGKSTLLKEIHRSALDGMINDNDAKWLSGLSLIINDAEIGIYSMFSQSDISQIDNYEQHQVADIVGFRPFRYSVRSNLRSYNISSIISSGIFYGDGDIIVGIGKLHSASQLQYTNEFYVRKLFADVEIIGEFCDSRLSQQYVTNISDVLQNNNDQSTVRYLLENPDLMKNVRKNIKDVFDIEIGFDDIQQGSKPLRIMPDKKPSGRLDQVSIAKEWRRTSPLVDSQGDGLRAYLKLVLSILDPFSRIIFIDEPETFLHPPQRKALGSLVADVAVKYNKQLFIATHDSEFIRGLINAGSDVKVLNLQKKDGIRSIVEMDLNDIKSVIQQAGNRLKERARILDEAILNSLFYNKTILTEDENDRIFYEYYAQLRQSVLLQNKRFIGLRGIDDVLNMMQKMHELGINIACIVDIDFLVTRYAPDYIKRANPNLHASHVNIRSAYENMAKDKMKLFKDKLKKSGLKSLDQVQCKSYETLIDLYAGVGIYIPKVGELESWTNSSKNNLSYMLCEVEKRNPRQLNMFMKRVLN